MANFSRQYLKKNILVKTGKFLFRTSNNPFNDGKDS